MLKGPPFCVENSRVSRERSFAEEMWAIFVHSVDHPALVVAADGSLIEANAEGALALESVSQPSLSWDGASPAATALPDGWLARPLDHNENYFLVSESAGHVRDLKQVGVISAGEDVRDQLLRQFFGTDGVIFVVCRADGVVVEANHEWQAVLGQALPHDGEPSTSSPGAEAPNFWSLVADQNDATPTEIESSLRETGTCQTVLQMTAANGSKRAVQWSLSLDMKSMLLFAVGRDITAEQTLTVELERMAFHDGLTGLANRANLVRTITSYLDAGQQPAVLFCDLDRFKVVNDSLGHRAGDRLLTMLAQRLLDVTKTSVRRDEATVGRLGGDEFVVVLANADEASASNVATRMLDVIDRPFIIQGRSVRVGMSVGIAVAREGIETDATALLGEADTGAYYAKDNQRGQFVVHDSALQERLDRRFDIEAGLIKAIAEDRFEVHYQPVVELPSTQLVGVEALVRWRDINGQLRQPAEFLDIAADAGLIGDIGDRVLTVATSEIAQIIDAGADLSVAVNATAGQIASRSFVDAVKRALETNNLAPNKLTVELTESAVLSNMDATIPVLNAIRALGVRIAVDDFGTGYSSLSYLQQLPIDSVKIDRSFVTNIHQDKVTRSVVSAVMHLAEALDLSVVIEGIETQEQADVIIELGGRLAQGYLYHQPVALADLGDLLTSKKLA